MAGHAKKEVDTSLGYERNEIGSRGIIITTVALAVVCVFAFVSMWFLQIELEKYWVANEKVPPMALGSKDKLPPEPRLQAAPGFGVDSPNGRINLELKPPQAEWIELQKLWAAETKHGQKIVANGKETVVTLPIEEAKKRLLAEGVKSAAVEPNRNIVDETNSYYSSASGGRKASGRRK